VDRATVQINILLLGLAFCRFVFMAAAERFAALVHASKKAFCDNINANFEVGVDSIDQHRFD